ncbi:hypothetical protein D3C80_809370 [compost metagenome]
MRQHQRVGQAMGNMKVPTQRIGQGMHRRHRCIGKGLAGQACPQQHGLAGLQVAAIVHSLVKVIRQQPQRLTGQQAG